MRPATVLGRKFARRARRHAEQRQRGYIVVGNPVVGSIVTVIPAKRRERVFPRLPDRWNIP